MMQERCWVIVQDKQSSIDAGYGLWHREVLASDRNGVTSSM